MKKSERESIENQAETMKGKRRNRYISKKEIDKMESIDRKATLKGKTIRVYSFDGFVPNSYKYFAPIDFIERSYEPETGKKIFRVGQTGASRSHGSGSLITVNGRSY